MFSAGGNLMSMKKLSLELEIGQEIIVGKNNERAKITKIEYHEKSGVINLHTTKGPRKALTFKLIPEPIYENVADKFR